MSFCLPGCKFPLGNEQLGLPDESPPGHSRQSPDLDTVPELEEDVSLLVRYSDECLPVEKPSRERNVEVSPLEKMFDEAEENQRKAYRANVAAEFVQDLIRQTAERIAMEAIEKAEAEAIAEAKARAEAEAMAILEAKEKDKQKVEIPNVAAEFVQDLIRQTAERIAMDAIEKAEAEARAEAKAKAEAEAMAILEAKEKDQQKVEIANVAAEFVQDMIILAAGKIAKESIEDAEAEIKAEEEDVTAEDVYTKVDVAVADAQFPVEDEVHDVPEVEEDMEGEEKLNLFCKDYISEVLSVVRAQLFEEDLNTFAEEVVTFNLLSAEENVRQDLMREELFCKTLVTEVISAAVSQALHQAELKSQSRIDDSLKENIEAHDLEDEENLFCQEYVSEIICADRDRLQKELNIFSSLLVEETLNKTVRDLQEGSDKDGVTGHEYDKDGVTGNEYDKDGVTGHEYDKVGVTGHEYDKDGVTGHEYDKVGVTGHEYDKDGVTGHEYDKDGVTGHEYVKDGVTGHEYDKDGVTGHEYDKDGVTGHEYDEREDLFCQEHVADVLSCSREQLEDERLNIFALDLVNETLDRASQKDPLERDKSKFPSEQEEDEICTKVSVKSSCLKSHVSKSLSGPKRVTFSETTIEHRISRTSTGLEKELRRARSWSVRLQRAKHREHMLGLEELFKSSDIQNQLAGRKSRNAQVLGMWPERSHERLVVRFDVGDPVQGRSPLTQGGQLCQTQKYRELQPDIRLVLNGLSQAQQIREGHGEEQLKSVMGTLK